MGWSIKLGTIAGTAIRVHVTFALLLVWIWLMHYRIGGTPAAVEGIAFVIAVFVCVVLHEFGHIAAARRFGINTPDITLLPIGGVARLERMPEEPGQEFVIAIAGPLVNVAIASSIGTRSRPTIRSRRTADAPSRVAAADGRHLPWRAIR